MQSYLQDKYYLSHLDIHRNLTIGGTPLFKQIHETSNKYALPSPNFRIGKLLLETSKIITWNMQGACNIDIVKMFLGTHKPAILALQEARVTLDNKSTFYHNLFIYLLCNCYHHRSNDSQPVHQTLPNSGIIDLLLVRMCW